MAVTRQGPAASGVRGQSLSADAPLGSAPPRRPDERGQDLGWPLTYATLLVVVDCLSIFVGLVAAYVLRFGDGARASVNGLSYALLLVLAGPVWLAALTMHRCYDTRTFGAGP